eukprot:4492922-Amphidinium_carterae.1
MMLQFAQPHTRAHRRPAQEAYQAPTKLASPQKHQLVSRRCGCVYTAHPGKVVLPRERFGGGQHSPIDEA